MRTENAAIGVMHRGERGQKPMQGTKCKVLALIPGKDDELAPGPFEGKLVQESLL